MGQRRRARECALQMLYQIDLAGGRPEEVFPDFWGALELEDDARIFAERLVRGTIAQREALDDLITACSAHWRIERMPAVDRNVLRMATYEMLFEDDTPIAVAIDEAIEIARRFGGEQSVAFVNGVLDAIRLRAEGSRP